MNCHDGAHINTKTSPVSVLGVSSFTPGPHILTTGSTSCDDCHTSTYTANYSKWGPNTAMNHAKTSLTCTSCHNTTPSYKTSAGANGNSMMTVADYPTPGVHIPLANGTQCGPSCHSTSNWLGALYQHASSDAGNCATCHNGSMAPTYTTLWAGHSHIPFTGSCDVCHTTTLTAAISSVSTATWAGGKYHGLGGNNSAAAGNCTTCHSGSYKNGSTVLGTSSFTPGPHIPTTGSVSCDDCHTSSYTSNYTKWGPGTAMNHAKTSLTCTSCHSTSPSYKTSVGANGNSMMMQTDDPNNTVDHTGFTNAQCSTCHASTASWLGATYTHIAADAGQCATCHNGTTAPTYTTLWSGHSHIPFTGSCDVCHTTTLTAAIVNVSTATWSGGKYHAYNTPAVATCTNCHNGSYKNGTTVLGTGDFTPGPHILTTGSLNCDDCHTKTYTANYTKWGPGTLMNHAKTSLGCTSCHSTSPSYKTSALSGEMMIQTDDPNNAVDHTGFTNAQCSTCHASTASWLGATYTHIAADAGQCATCHNGTTAPTYTTLWSGHSHIPFTGSCDVCHTTTLTAAISNVATATWAGGKYHAHVTAATGTCATCHNGTYKNGATVLSTTDFTPGPHILTTGSASCDDCHTSSTTASYTKWGPSTPMNHAKTALTCTSCHSTAPSYKTSAGANGNSMMMQTDDPNNGVDHSGFTNALCSTCHTTTSWLGATYTHIAADAGQCATCHNGTTAPTYTTLWSGHTHIPSAASCDVCHKTALTSAISSGAAGTWSPGAYHANVAATANTCSTCHGGGYKNGTTVLGTADFTPGPHILTTGSTNCDDCHTSSTTASYTKWGPSTPMNHTKTSLTCTSCHSTSPSYSTSAGANGNSMMMQTDDPNNTVDHTGFTNAQCSTCHTTTSWLGATYTHIAADAGQCATCHNGTTAPTYTTLWSGHSHIPSTGSCDVCHTATLTAAISSVATATWSGGKYHAYNTPAAGTCTTCHSGTYKNGTTILSTTDFTPGPHIPTTGSVSCDDCHTSSYTSNYTKWGPGTAMNHAKTSLTCTSCHSTSPSYKTSVGANGNSMMMQTDDPNNALDHIGNTNALCSTCHATTNWLGATYTHNSADAGNCASCHNGTAAPTYTTLWSGHTHIPNSGSCDVCHTTTLASAISSVSTATWAGGKYHTYNTAATGSCVTCHSGTYKNGTTVLSTTDFTPGPHIPTTGSASCDDCHTNTAYTAWGPNTSMNHTKTSLTCTSCHSTSPSYKTSVGANGNSMMMQTDDPNTAVDHANNINALCSNCHTTSSWLGAGNHAHTAADAGQCATSCHAVATPVNGQAALFPTHFATGTMACDTCHTTSLTAAIANVGTASWKPGTMVHSAPLTIAGACQNCHKGQYSYVTSMTGGSATTGGVISCKGTCVKGLTLHMPVTVTTCDTCHTSTTNWDVYTFSHTGIQTSPCLTCHSVNASSPYASFGNTGAQSTTAVSHIPYWTSIQGFSTATDCGTCHSSNAIPSGWATEKMSHNSISTSPNTSHCYTCHLTGATYLGNAQKKSHNGASATKDCDTSGCHAPGGKQGSLYSSW